MYTNRSDWLAKPGAEVLGDYAQGEVTYPSAATAAADAGACSTAVGGANPPPPLPP
ncbi:hypothetical protein OROHE_000705 [Orobanche hederae]